MRKVAIEAEVENLCGVIVRERRYGPPNYGEDPKADNKVIIAWLDLDRSIFVNKRGTPSDFFKPYITSRVQVLPILPLLKLQGQRVCVSGSLDEAVAPADYYPTVLHMAERTTGSLALTKMDKP